MALFKRKEQVNQQVPLEIQEYYQAERKERSGLAWLLALGTLAVTLLLATGIFFGGRWVYRKTVNKAPQTATNQAEQNDNKSRSDDDTSSTTNRDSTNSSSSAPSATAPGTATTTTPSPSGSTPSSPTPQTSPTTPAPQVVATTQTSGLPSTGPGDVVAIFVIVSLAAAMAHRTFHATRNS